MSKRVLVAVTSPSLARVIEHLLGDLPELEVRRSASANAVSVDAVRLCPDVIVTSARGLRTSGAGGAAALQRSCPGSKLVVITSDGDPWSERASAGGADASLDEEDLVRGLVPIVHILTAGSAPAVGVK